MTFTAPKENPDVITNDIEAGEYLGIAFDIGRISQEQMTALKTKLEATKAKLEAQDFTGLTKDDVLGDLLYTTALAYYAELDAMDYVAAKTIGVIAIRLPSETIFSFELKVNSFMGMPLSVNAGGFVMDLDRAMTLAKALEGDQDKTKQFMSASGVNSSALENSVPEQLFSTPDTPAEGISAVKALQIANDQGIPIYTINQTNINSILPQLQVDSDVKADIINAINAGKIVLVSKTNISFNGWTGCGYIIIDPSTGAGAYMISGGLSGAWTIIGVLGLLVLIIAASIGISVALVLLVAAIANIQIVLAYLIGTLLFWGPILQWAFYECAFIILPASPPDLITVVCTLILMFAGSRPR